jgi:hypothetical protein
MKDCIKCKERKALEDFVKDAGHMDGRKNICKTCYNVRNKQWRKENTELNRQIQRDYGKRIRLEAKLIKEK